MYNDMTPLLLVIDLKVLKTVKKWRPVITFPATFGKEAAPAFLGIEKWPCLKSDNSTSPLSSTVTSIETSVTFFLMKSKSRAFLK